MQKKFNGPEKVKPKIEIIGYLNPGFISNSPKTKSMTEAMIMILGEPFLVTPKAPILPEYEVTPTPDPIKGLSHVSTKYRRFMLKSNV